MSNVTVAGLTVDRAVPNDWSVAHLVERLRGYRRYRDTVRELSGLSDAQLDDIGIHRWEIEARAHRRSIGRR